MRRNLFQHVLLKNFKSPLIKKPRISTHVMDTSKGLPVGGLQVSLYKLMDGRWTFLNERYYLNKISFFPLYSFLEMNIIFIRK